MKSMAGVGLRGGYTGRMCGNLLPVPLSPCMGPGPEFCMFSVRLRRSEVPTLINGCFTSVPDASCSL